MQIFQRNILNKYIEGLDSSLIDKQYKLYSNYFLNPEIQVNIHQSKEEQFQEGFLRELFVKVLGYSLNPSPNYNLITEQKNEDNSKKADGAILVNGKVVGVIELKDHKTPDLSQIETQAFGYKNKNMEAVYVVTSNFEKLRFYIDNAVVYEEFDLFHLTRDDFARLWICLAYENIAKNLPKQIKAASLTNEDQITNALYKDYSNFKRDLFEDILKNNPTDDTEHKILLFKKTQKLLDRLLFIFFAEDRGLLPPNLIMIIIDQWEKLKEFDDYQPFYDRLKKYFGYMNTGHPGKNFEIFAYNGGLFKPDEVLDGLTISDEVLMKYCKKLSDYDFVSDVDVNILGHIFENSLTEIEEITTKLQQGETPTISKRKKDGVFYTPQYITKYIVENTVGKLCKEKKAELGIDESEYFTDKKRQVATKKALIQRLDAYRDWLLQISICDPACGSGAFLNAALNFLITEHKLIDEMSAKIEGAAIVFPNIENSILENNLYGVDINEESVEIAKLSLWLRTAKPHRKLNSLNNNIKCGNSLIDDPGIAGDKAFNWAIEFPKVFEKGGFDVVIGNPPYLRVQGLRENHEKETVFYEHNYSSATGRFDFYVLFMERGFSLLNKDGVLSFILPHKFINADFGVGIRGFIYNNRALKYLVSFGAEQVFNDASVYTCIIGLSQGNVFFNYAKVKPLELCENTVNQAEISIESLADDARWSFQSNEDSNIISKLNKQPLRFKDITKACSQGTVSMGDDIYMLKGEIEGDSFVGFSEQIQQSVKLEKGIMKPMLKGDDAKRYAPLDNSCWEIYPHHIVNGKTVPYEESEMQEMFPLTYEYLMLFKSELVEKKIKYKTNPKYWYALHRSREITLFETPKIITPEISLGCNMTYDTGNLYHNTQCYTIIFDEGHEKNTLAYLTILNSTVFWFFLAKTGNILRGGYFRFKTKYLEPFPLPDLSSLENKDKANSLTIFAEQMLLLNAQLQQKRQRFIHRLEENLGVQRITATLEHFDEADFKTVLAELKKQKISLTLIQQDEWEDYFNQYKTDCNTLTEQIAATDKEIDNMVYQLYGLTEEEIKIVEGE